MQQGMKARKIYFLKQLTLYTGASIRYNKTRGDILLHTTSIDGQWRDEGEDKMFLEATL